jgi:hypothetical protein
MPYGISISSTLFKPLLFVYNQTLLQFLSCFYYASFKLYAEVAT